MQPYPRAPDLVWPGYLNGTGCLSARAMDTGFPTVAWRLCFGLGCGWLRVSAAPRHSWPGCWDVCALVCALRLYPATPGWGVRCGCVWLRSSAGCADPLLAGVSGFVTACVRAPLAPRHSWLGCAVWVCLLRFGCRLPPASPGWGVGVCVCLCACSACTPPLLAGACGVGVCAWDWVSAAPRHPWLGCWGAGVGALARVAAAPRHSRLRCWGVRVSVCALHLYPATPGWGVWCGRGCLGSGCACALPLLAGVLGCACVCVRTPLVPRHSWLGWSSVCVLVCVLCLYPATPGWGVRCGCVRFGWGFGCAPPLLSGVLGCACLCVCIPCTPPLLAGVCGVGVCVPALVSAAPRHSWLGCWAVRACSGAPLVACHFWLGCAVCGCVLGLGFWLRPASPGWGAGACVCWCGRSACTSPLLARVCVGGVCVWARGCTRHSWLGFWGLRVCVPAPPVPRQSWQGCAAWVCVLGLGFRLRAAIPGWGVGLCVCSCARPACTPPLLAGLCCVGVCVSARVRLRPATLAWGVGVCVCWCAHSTCTPPLLAGVCGAGVGALARVAPAPCHSWLGCEGVRVSVCALRLYPATLGWHGGVCVC